MPKDRNMPPVAFSSDSRQRQVLTYVLLLAAVCGLAVRFVLAAVTVGSNDVTTWKRFAQTIHSHGLLYTYRHEAAFNHPPLMGYWAQFAERLAGITGLGFPFVFKFPGILADVLAAGLLWSLWERRRGLRMAAVAAALFAWNWTSLLVSGYHGNTDSLYACLCLLCVYWIDGKQRHFAAGLALAAAINVKLIPLLLVPPLASRCRSVKELLRFATGLGLGLLPFVPILILAGSSFYRNAIAYNSNLDNWGVALFLIQSYNNPKLAEWAANLSDWYLVNGRFLVLGTVGGLSLWAYLSQRWSAAELAGMTLALFLILTPGFGVQYVAIVCPLLFAIDLKMATLYSTLAGIFLGIAYYSFETATRGYSIFIDYILMPAPLFGMLAWAVLIGFVVRTVRRPSQEFAGRSVDANRSR